MKKTTVTFTRYKEPNWLIFKTIDSLAAQSDVVLDVLLVDQQDDPEACAYCKSASNQAVKFDYHTIPAKSLSYARNYAIENSDSDILLFIDSDAMARPGWARGLADALMQPSVAVAGGRILPHWHKPPLLLARSSIVQDQYSLLDLGDKSIRYHKVIGASFGINKARLGKNSYFDEGLGRKDGVLLGGEETELCRRATDQGFEIEYVGSAVVEHNILPERICYLWIFKRLYYAGVSRAMRGGRPSPNSSKRDMWDYGLAPLILIPYVWGYMKGAKRHRG